MNKDKELWRIPFFLLMLFPFGLAVAIGGIIGFLVVYLFTGLLIWVVCAGQIPFFKTIFLWAILIASEKARDKWL